MSLDVWFWYRAVGDVEDVLDELAEDDGRSLVPDASVLSFRRALLAELPHLRDVTEPDAGSPLEMSYVCLTLPVAWAEDLPRITALAGEHGVTGWDPQTTESLGVPAPQEPSRSPISLDDHWTAGRLRGFGIGARSVARAWKLAGLPQQVGFGEAVGVLILAMALRDGGAVDREAARQAVATVADHCAGGIPAGETFVSIGFSTTEVTGFARALSQGDVADNA